MNQGRIIVITGSPGTGKTTTASIVAKESDMDKSVHILQSVTCHLLFVTLTYPVENTRVYKRASSPLCFLCVYVAFSSQQTTRTHWRK